MKKTVIIKKCTGHYFTQIIFEGCRRFDFLNLICYICYHQSLGYLTRMEFMQKKQGEKVLPISSTCTKI